VVPPASKWKQNFLQPGLNNYRQAAQGSVGAEALPDLTAEFQSDACTTVEPELQLTAEVCNRGAKPVGAGLPTTFYKGDPMDGMPLCTATTVDVLFQEMCVKVSCLIPGPIGGKVSVVANDDGMGGKTTNECVETNNGDVIDPILCQ
jgi:hypothetical protein